GVGDPYPVVHQLAVERLGHEVLADALDLPGLRAAAGEHAALGVGPDDLDVGVALLEVAAHPGDGAAGADAGDEDGDAALGLLPQCGAGGAVVDLGVGEVGDLVGPPRPGNLAGQPVSDAVVALRRVRRDACRRDDDLGPVGFQERYLLGGHLVGQDEDAAV